MELIQIDVVKRFISSNVYVKDGELTKVVLLDTETGVVYFNGK